MSEMHPYCVEYEFQERVESVHVTAKSRSAARYDAWHATGAADCDEPFGVFLQRVRGVRKVDRIPPSVGERQRDEWNALHPVGTTVRYWPSVRKGMGTLSKTRGPARAISPDHASVHVEGHGSCIALSHVEPIDPTASTEPMLEILEDFVRTHEKNEENMSALWSVLEGMCEHVGDGGCVLCGESYE